MNKQVHKIRQHYRQNIRKVQIEAVFRHKRMQFKQIIHQDIKEQVNNHLNAIKNVITLNRQKYNLLQPLAQLHKITCEYNIVNILCQYVPFNPEEIQNQGKLDLNNKYSWFDLLIQIIKQGGCQIMIEEASSIVCNCIEQLKIIVSSSFESNCSLMYSQQMKRAMESYPFQILKDGSNKTIINSLQIIYFISLTGNNSNFVYFLLNKSKPPLLKILHILYINKPTMDYQTKHQYLVVCLTFISLVHYYHLQNHQAEYYDKIKQNIIELGLEKFHQGQTKEDFSAACQLIRIMINVQVYSPSQQQFREMQEYIARQAQEQNQVYFKMLQSIMYFGTSTLQPKSIRIIMECLFNSQAFEEIRRVQFRITLLKLLKGQINNNNNKINVEMISLFKQLWGTNGSACYLIKLSQAIHTYNQKHLKLLFEIISCILIEQQCSIQLLQQHFYPLLQYIPFRVMLQQIGYSLQGEDEL